MVEETKRSEEGIAFQLASGMCKDLQGERIRCLDGGGGGEYGF